MLSPRRITDPFLCLSRALLYSIVTWVLSHKMRYFSFKSDTLFQRVFISLVLLIGAVPAVYRSYGIYRADRIVRTRQTVEDYSYALKYDPSNAVLWWHRGRLNQYALESPNIDAATEDYAHALTLNPRIGQAWVDSSDCFDRAGKFSEAEEALEKAFAVHTYSPLIRWQAGNFFLRRGNLPKMYECFRLASQYDDQKLDIAIEIAWKIDPDHERIMENLIPDTLVSNLKYLRFLVAQDELDLAGPVWQRCMKSEIPEDMILKPSSAYQFIDRLLARSRVEDALHVWNDILRKSRSGLVDNRLQLKPTTLESDQENLVWNGSFENEILNGGFDWRHLDIPSIQFQVDAGNRMQGLKSLRVQFGDANLASILLCQVIPIPKSGPYQLDFYLRTEGLTTDQMPYISVGDYREASRVFARSTSFPPTAAWSKFTVPFTANDDCKVVLLALQRERSIKFDNQIKGNLWLDGFTIHALTAPHRGNLLKP
jgi:tetratricopeptide (TPR) repeat protein